MTEEDLSKLEIQRMQTSSQDGHAMHADVNGYPILGFPSSGFPHFKIWLTMAGFPVTVNSTVIPLSQSG